MRGILNRRTYCSVDSAERLWLPEGAVDAVCVGTLQSLGFLVAE